MQYGVSSLNPGNKPVVVFDGFCVFCSASARFIIRHDRKGKFLLTTGNSEAAQQLLSRSGIREQHSVLLFHNGMVYEKSKAVLHIAKGLDFPWSLAAVFSVLPSRFSDIFYDFIAERRLQWWGRTEQCFLPSEKERSRII